MKKVLISIFTFIFIMSMITVVNAAVGSISLSSSTNQVVKGNTFTVTLTATADENITGLEAALSFDTTKLSLEDKAAGTGFSDLSGSDSEIAIASTNNDTLATSGTLYTLTFRVLETAEDGETTINVTNAQLALLNDSQVQENVSVANQSVTITVRDDDTTVGNDDNNNNVQDDGNNGAISGVDDNNSSNGGNNNSNRNNSSNGSNNSDNQTTRLPQTGSEVGSIIAIAILSVFAVVSYTSYKKYKNI